MTILENEEAIRLLKNKVCFTVVTDKDTNSVRYAWSQSRRSGLRSTELEIN